MNGSAADYVFALNYHRRHLSDGGRKLASGRYKEIAAKEAKERQRQAGGDKKSKQRSVVKTSSPPIKTAKARDVAGEKFGVSGPTVDAAAKVLAKAAPEVIQAVEQDKMKVTTAARLADAPKAEQKAVIK